MSNTHHHRGQRATKRRKLDRIFREHASTRRRERNAEAKLMATFTGLPLPEPDPLFNEPQFHLFEPAGNGKHVCIPTSVKLSWKGFRNGDAFTATHFIVLNAFTMSDDTFR